jgi:hypothetical protein
MFDLDKAIAEWRRRMALGGLGTPEYLDELESHLRDDVEAGGRAGLSAQQSFEAAVERMGRVRALKNEFAKLRWTRWAVKMKRFVARIFGIPALSLNEFTSSARQTLDFAREEAPRFHHNFIGTEHVLLGLLRDDAGMVLNILRSFGVDRARVRDEIEKIVGIGPDWAVAAKNIPYTPRAQKALRLAAVEAAARHHREIGPEHIFLGLLLEGDGVAVRVLKSLGVELERTRELIAKGMRGGTR